MWINKISCVILVCFLGACSPYQVQFLQVMQDHKMVTELTCDELISDIKTSLPDYNEAKQKKLLVLIDRLQYIKDSSNVLNKYVVEKTYDQQMLLDMIKMRRKIKNGE